MRESELNALLRRVDWRFLLPGPFRVAACLGDPALASALRLVADDVREDIETASSPCDLAVLVEPDDALLRAAARGLTANGMFYAEWSRPRRSVAEVRRRLGCAGLHATATYWTWPPPKRGIPRMWLPSEARAPLAFLGRLARSGPLRDRLRRLVRRVAISLPFAAMLLPIAVVGRAQGSQNGRGHPADRTARPRARRGYARSAASARDLGLPPELGAALRSHWADWGLGPPPAELSCLMLSGGDRTISKVVLLVFAEPSPIPRVAVKLARVPAAARGLAREAAVLVALHAADPTDIEGAPRVLLHAELDGATRLLETALIGTPLFHALHRKRHERLASVGARWLGKLASVAPVPERDDVVADRAQRALGDFAEMYRKAVDPGLLRETERRVADLRSLPLVVEQRDFGPWNLLLMEHEELGVLDWESAELQGLPALDLLYYLTYLAFHVERAKTPEQQLAVYRASCDRRTRLGSIRAAALDEYCSAIGLKPGAFPGLAAILWIIHARSEHDRLRADRGFDASTGVGSALFVRLWEQELRS